MPQLTGMIAAPEGARVEVFARDLTNPRMLAVSDAGIQNTAMAVNYGRSALGGLAQAETSTQQLKDVNDAMLIAQRAAQLEKVKFEKGC